IDRLVAGVQYENRFLQSARHRHRQEAPTVFTVVLAGCANRRSTRATVRKVTDRAPARLSAEAQALPVAPVVITSSTRRTRSPSSRRPPRARNAPLTFCRRFALLSPVC